MKKSQLDHLLRAASRITNEKQFIIIGSQSLHARFPDLPDVFSVSNEADIIAKLKPDVTEWLNAIGADSQFHETFGYYADPVDEKTATLPRGWKKRLIKLPPGDTGGAIGLCLDPHDLAISKYFARREKDIDFTRGMTARGIVKKDHLLTLLALTDISDADKKRIRQYIEADFKAQARG
jgi:hypothetical protein